ncbi:multidrug DMT transporter permease [Niabella ginsenosidivorans]|uniref:Multidrug DMT transporter permease n=1 Tax=Niabella ginsenosidivorans TaxID=1176587 RepID=A0A1A9I3S5_9BACT|nr:multidrug DMT transporter permease [Niabella ginsenosidivorans]ANH81224.1 multidrug DMT transporter permease [Niabella ginsenosidivorans]
MFVAETYSIAIILLFITMICWGSWPVLQKMAGASWRFELFYWDYVLGIVAVTLLLAFTLGSFGNYGSSFMEDLRQADLNNLISAAIGGVIFNAANILFVAAIAIAGMAVAFSIGAGTGLILGVVVNYIALPAGKPVYLFGGVIFIAAAILLSSVSHRRVSGNHKFSGKGIILSLLAGILFGCFYRFVAAAMYPNFKVPESGRLGPYSATCCFAFGVLISNLLLNTLLMKKPFQGKPLGFKDYLAGSVFRHLMGVLAGAVWGLGLTFSILSAGNAGFAISFGLGQGNAMVAAIWGVFVWKEFRNAPPGTSWLLYSMFCCYIIGVLLIIYAKS